MIHMNLSFLRAEKGYYFAKKKPKTAKFQYLGHDTTRMENCLVIWKP